MIYKGNSPIDSLYVGGKLVQKVYLGGEKVYSGQVELADMNNAETGFVRQVDGTWQIVSTYGVHRGAFIKINLKDYDSVTINNSIDLASLSTSDSPIYSYALFEGDISSNNLLAGSTGYNNSTYNIYASDYANYENVTLYVTIAHSEDSSQPTEKDEDISVIGYY